MLFQEKWFVLKFISLDNVKQHPISFKSVSTITVASLQCQTTTFNHFFFSFNISFHLKKMLHYAREKAIYMEIQPK